MTTNPTPADLDQKPSERIRELRRGNDRMGMIDAIVAYLDEQAAGENSNCSACNRLVCRCASSPESPDSSEQSAAQPEPDAWLSAICWSCGDTRRAHTQPRCDGECVDFVEQAPQGEERVLWTRHVPTQCDATFPAARFGFNCCVLDRGHDGKHHNTAVEWPEQAEATPAEKTMAFVDSDACYCSDYQSSGCPCLPGRCPNVPLAATAPAEPDDEECNTESDTCELCGLVVTDEGPQTSAACVGCGIIVCSNCYIQKGDGPTCRTCRHHGFPVASSSVIRAAEGVTLEPGEYEVVEIATNESFPAHAEGERVRLSERLISKQRDSWVFVFETVDSFTWVSAVRRVAPVAEPEPVFPEDAFRKFKEGGYMASSREPEPVPESGGDTLDLGPLRILLDRANGTSEYFAGRAVIDRIALERDELRSKVSELESQPSGKYFGMLRMAMGDRWKDCSSWADAIPQVSELVATLAATEAHSQELERAAKERIAGLDAQLATLGAALESTENSAHEEVTRLHEQLAATEAKLRVAIEDCGDADAEREQLKAELTRSAVLTRAKLDEELQQVDDAVEAAGGPREQGAVAFIASLTAELARLREELANPDAGRERWERAPTPMFLTCPKCNARHIDDGEFATKPHHTHSCQACGLTWRPAVRATVGVNYLPGFKDREPSKHWAVKAKGLPPIISTETPAVAAPAFFVSIDGSGAQVSDLPLPATAIPRGTTLEVGRWYRITGIDDPRPRHVIGDVIRCGYHEGEIHPESADSFWFALATDGGTYVTGVELVPGPEVKEQK